MNGVDRPLLLGAVVATAVVLYFLLVPTRPLTGIALGLLVAAFAAALSQWLR